MLVYNYDHERHTHPSPTHVNYLNIPSPPIPGCCEINKKTNNQYISNVEVTLIK